MELTCVDLRDAFPRFMVYPSEDHVPGATISPWNLELRGRWGRVWPHGGSRLQAYCVGGAVRRNALRRLRGVVPWQLGDAEVVVLVEVGAPEIPEVCRLLGIRPKRGCGGGPPMSQEAKEALQRARKRAKNARSSSGEGVG